MNSRRLLAVPFNMFPVKCYAVETKQGLHYPNLTPTRHTQAVIFRSLPHSKQNERRSALLTLIKIRKLPAERNDVGFRLLAR